MGKAWCWALARVLMIIDRAVGMNENYENLFSVLGMREVGPSHTRAKLAMASMLAW
jgi:hypothetical protein